MHGNYPDGCRAIDIDRAFESDIEDEPEIINPCIECGLEAEHRIITQGFEDRHICKDCYFEGLYICSGCGAIYEDPPETRGEGITFCPDRRSPESFRKLEVE